MFLSICLASICQVGTIAYLVMTQKAPPLPWDDLLIEDYLIFASATWGSEWC